ncbi:MAG: radical SAM protein [Candidatus Omnitrophica bacterium]|nr:radical SAM protein [Candidatus Omnitrophota bacterium]
MMKKYLSLLKVMIKKWLNLLNIILHVFQVRRMLKMAQHRPLWLQVETINACNSRCIFCSYPMMKRPPQVLALEIFEKVIGEYSQMGGGAVSLTPIGGDPLLDPLLIKRFEVLSRYQNINQISFTTNGIAFGKYSDEELKFILKNTFLVQLSVGGLDPAGYKDLYGVDQLDNVLASIERLLKIKESIHDDVIIYLTFRTNDPLFKKTYSKELEIFKQQGLILSDMSVYMNYGGMVKNDPNKKLVIIEADSWIKSDPCVMPLGLITVMSNGLITGCGCVNMNGDCLIIGNAKHESLQACWEGLQRRNLLATFKQGHLIDLCKKCSAYQGSSSIFAKSIFKKFYSYQQVPLEFYLSFTGG